MAYPMVPKWAELGKGSPQATENPHTALRGFFLKHQPFFFPPCFSQYLPSASKFSFEIKLYVWPIGANYQILRWMCSFTQVEKGRKESLVRSVHEHFSMHTSFIYHGGEVWRSSWWLLAIPTNCQGALLPLGMEEIADDRKNGFPIPQ